MDYLMVLPVSFYQIDSNRIACESAFIDHLRILRQQIQGSCSRIHIVAPSMSEADYQLNGRHLGELNMVEENIFYTPGYPAQSSRAQYAIRHSWKVVCLLWSSVKKASIIHSSPTVDFFKPFEILSILFGVFLKRKTLFVLDIDERNSGKMSYLTGRFSKKSYLLKKYIYDPYMSLQIKFAVRYCDLLLLKGKALVEDYGKGLPHVKNFLDTAHSPDAVIPDKKLQQKLSAWDGEKKDINLIYFGRLTEYKGVADIIQAVALAKQRYAEGEVRLLIVGSGEQQAELQVLCKELGIEQCTTFAGALPYGQELFDAIYSSDLLLAAPLGEDTPRNVFDAMANGVPTLAYDTYYYKDLESSGAVSTVPWRDIDALADAIISLVPNTQEFPAMVESAVSFARNNTQEIWMEQRLGWMKEYLL